MYAHLYIHIYVIIYLHISTSLPTFTSICISTQIYIQIYSSSTSVSCMYLQLCIHSYIFIITFSFNRKFLYSVIYEEFESTRKQEIKQNLEATIFQEFSSCKLKVIFLFGKWLHQIYYELFRIFHVTPDKILQLNASNLKILSQILSTAFQNFPTFHWFSFSIFSATINS